MVRSRLWTGTFLLGTLINFLLLLNYFLLIVVMSEYSVSHFQVSESMAGLSASLFVIGIIPARLFSAFLMEKMGGRRLLLLGMLLEVTASVLYFFTINLPVLFVNRLLHGLSYGMASTSVSTLVTGLIPKDRHGEGIGYFMLSFTLGSAIGPFCGIFLLNHSGYEHIFIACILTAVVGLMASFLFLSAAEVKERATVSHTTVSSGRWKLENIIEPKAVPISMIAAGIYFCYSSIVSFLTPYANQTGLQTASAFFFMVYSLVIFVSRFFTGRLFDVKGERAAMVPAFVSFFIGMLLLSQTHQAFTLLLSAGFVGFGVGIVQSCGMAVAVRNVPFERLSYANSTFYLLIDAGNGIGPFILGFLIPFTGYRGMYLAMAGCAVWFGVLYLAISRKPKK